MATLKNTVINDTGYLHLPSGSTAQRPISPEAGYTRFNTSTSYFEVYDGTNWVNLEYDNTLEVEYLLIGGGGGGGFDAAGGGGGGGYVSGSFTATTSTEYNATIGSGGSAGTSVGTIAPNGGETSLFDLTASGGGGGGGKQSNGGSGASGGGGGHNAGSPFVGGTGTSGQGSNGGDGATVSGGGGGGATTSGQNGQSSKGGSGGTGIQSFLTGTSVYYSGGGGGGNWSGDTSGGSGGLGGGGNGGGVSITSTAGGANTGGGGGSQGNAGSTSTSPGGSGIVILRYPSSRTVTLSGGASTPSNEGEQTDGLYKYIRIITSGTLTFS